MIYLFIRDIRVYACILYIIWGIFLKILLLFKLNIYILLFKYFMIKEKKIRI